MDGYRFARAVRAGTNAIHRGDPEALAALEGAQVPGWGGYDYGQLAHAVDAMEIYDLGNAIEIARSLNPNLRVLVTCFGADAAELHRLWRVWLLGAQGTIIWDEDGSVAGPDGQPARVAHCSPRSGASRPAPWARSCWRPNPRRDRLRFLLAGQLPHDLAAGPAPGR